MFSEAMGTLFARSIGLNRSPSVNLSHQTREKTLLSQEKETGVKSADADVNQPCLSSGLTPLWLAVIHNKGEAIRTLRKGGARLTTRTLSGGTETMLYAAVKYGNVEAVEALLDMGGVAVDEGLEWYSEDSNGQISPLSCAIGNNNKKIVELLVKAGAGKERLSYYVHDAARKGYSKILEIFIANGADVNKTCYPPNHYSYNDYDTPLYKAVKGGYTDAVCVLIRAGADINQSKKNGKTLLHLAFEKNSVEIVDALVKGGATVDECYPSIFHEMTILHLSAKAGRLKMLEALVKAGIVNLSDNEGRTPLYIAAQNGQLEALNILISAGADVNQPKKNGKTPLHAAVEAGHIEIVKALLAASADKEAKGKYKRTPLDIAKKKGNLEIIELLRCPIAKLEPKGVKSVLSFASPMTPMYRAVQEITPFLKEHKQGMKEKPHSQSKMGAAYR